MLYAVFNLGDATHNIDGQAFRHWRSIPPSQAVPLSLGDSHRGFMWWSTLACFEHFRYADSRSSFSAGEPFADLFDAVIGADVAEQLGYRIGDRIILNHGTKDIGLTEHADKPFKVRGVLKRTGSPVDRSVHVSLEAIEAIHLDWQGGAPMPGLSIPADYVRKFDLAPKEITAVLIGLKSRAGVFQVQRFVNHYKEEPLLGVLPGVALDELWSIVGIVEKSLLIISALVVAVGLSGLAAVVLAGLGERRRELAVLRSVGAGPRVVFMLLAIEGLIIVVAGSCLRCWAWLHSAISRRLAWKRTWAFPFRGFDFCGSFGACARHGDRFLVSLVPGYAYRISLADGLTPRL
jgi:putative ABC transport system permease protein